MSTNYMYLIQWYGPFSNRKELKRWEDNQKENFSCIYSKVKGRTSVLSDIIVE